MHCLGGARALIFDLDGVLWDSNPSHERAYNEVLSEIGLGPVDFERLAGRGTREVMRSLLSAANRESAEFVGELTRRKQQRAHELLRTARPVVPGGSAMLRRLAKSYRLALASSSSPENVRLFLDSSDTSSLFDVVLHGQDVRRAKPDPEIYSATLRRLGIVPEEAVIIEDALSGVRAGVAAGVPVLAVAGAAPVEELLHAGACEVVPRLAEIEKRLLRIVDISFTNHLRPADPARWTAVIPAAGRGSRLGYDRPKVLYPLLGRPILDWLLDLVTAVATRVVVVASPSGATDIARHLATRSDIASAIVIQPEPTGMADAVLRTRDAVRTPHCLVVWGDQVTLRTDTLRACARLHESAADTGLTLPTVLRPDPYIHLRRDSTGRLVGVEQAREAPILVPIGENDCGLFCFSASALFSRLEEAQHVAAARGAGTGEFNLLQVLPQFEDEAGYVRTLRIADISETWGVNTPVEAERAARMLAARFTERRLEAG